MQNKKWNSNHLMYYKYLIQVSASCKIVPDFIQTINPQNIINI